MPRSGGASAAAELDGSAAESAPGILAQLGARRRLVRQAPRGSEDRPQHSEVQKDASERRPQKDGLRKTVQQPIALRPNSRRVELRRKRTAGPASGRETRRARAARRAASPGPSAGG